MSAREAARPQTEETVLLEQSFDANMAAAERCRIQAEQTESEVQKQYFLGLAENHEKTAQKMLERITSDPE
jgi:hypothetical protein